MRDLYAYLMSIPAIKQPNKPLPSPFNLPGARLSLWGWKLLFFFPINLHHDDARQSKEWNRGKYIVDSLGHCSMCHTPLNVFGAPKSRYYLTGTLLAVIGRLTLVSRVYLLQAFRTLPMSLLATSCFTMQALLPVLWQRLIYNSLSHLTEEDRLAMATYLKTVASDDPLAMSPSNAKPNVKRGKQVYLNTCIICHQDGQMSAPILGKGPNWSLRLQASV